ncbi:MAG: glycosyltransferase family 2 protein [Clostridia bacterium]|nr:glycosyltransferase family 2 protein [Clostridia bacterium]
MINHLVSIIVPIFGVSKYLDKCLKSIVDQSYRNLEIILVDDGGNDDCPKMIDEWSSKDERIVVIHKQNGGQSSARNAGLDACHGDYITFIDGDDWIETDYCEELINAIEAFDADISVGLFKRCYKKNVVLSKKFLNVSIDKYPCSPSQAVKYFLETSIAVWGKMYKKAVVESLRFPIGRLAEEYTFQLNSLLKSKVIAFCNKYIYDYRIRSDSAAHSIKPSYLLDNIQAMNECYKICNQSFQFEADYCLKHLSALIFEFTAAEKFGEDLLNTRREVLDDALDTVGGLKNLHLKMERPLDIIFYTYAQFHSLLTKKERRVLQKSFRLSFKKNKPIINAKFFLKYLPSLLSLEIVTRLFKAQRG